MNKRPTYAGIGSRKTPGEILDLMEQIAYCMAEDGAILRSGHARGADQAFERGCEMADGLSEIYLPWDRFANDAPLPKGAEKFVGATPRAHDLAMKFHPAYAGMSWAVRELIARNAHQVLGYSCEDPVDAVICYTPDAKGEGGTGQAIRIAHAYDIPVYDLADKNHRKIAWEWVT